MAHVYRRPVERRLASKLRPELFNQVVSGTGDLSATLGALVLSSTAALDIAGTLTKTLGSLTSASDTTLSLSGALDKTLGTLTTSSAGALDIVGTLSKTLGDVTLSSAGTFSTTADLSQTLGSLSLSSTGESSYSGTLSSVLGTLTSSSAAALTLSGILGGTLNPVTLQSVITNDDAPPVVDPTAGWAGIGGKLPGQGKKRKEKKKDLISLEEYQKADLSETIDIINGIRKVKELKVSRKELKKIKEELPEVLTNDVQETKELLLKLITKNRVEKALIKEQTEDEEEAILYMMMNFL